MKVKLKDLIKNFPKLEDHPDRDSSEFMHGEISGMNYMRDRIGSMEVSVDAEGVKFSLAMAQGCKPNMSDCSFAACDSWGKCEQIIKTITDDIKEIII